MKDLYGCSVVINVTKLLIIYLFKNIKNYLSKLELIY